MDGDTTFAGGTECLRATGSSRSDGQGHFIFTGGQVISTVVELTDPVRVYSVVPYGQSRRPESPHYADQAPFYAAHDPQPTMLDREVLEQNLTAHYRPGEPRAMN